MLFKRTDPQIRFLHSGFSLFEYPLSQINPLRIPIPETAQAIAGLIEFQVNNTPVARKHTNGNQLKTGI